MTTTHTITGDGHEAVITQGHMCFWTATLDGRTIPAPTRHGFATLDKAQRAVTRAMHDWYGLIPKAE